MKRILSTCARWLILALFALPALCLGVGFALLILPLLPFLLAFDAIRKTIHNINEYNEPNN